MDIGLAMTLTNRYVCSRCWGPLIALSIEGKLQVICAKNTLGSCNGRGYVTRNYANRRRLESREEAMEVRQNYGFLVQRPVLTETQILRSLGF